MPDPDAELLERARGGDPAAFDELYRRHVDRIYAVCLRMSADPERAERLTQDAFVRCWEKISTFRGDSRFSSWLHRLAVNVVLNDRRASRRLKRRLETELEPERYGAVVSEGRRYELIDVERAVARLPERARHVLVLYGIEGYKYREIAEMTGLAEGTVKAQIHRARQLLAEALEAGERDDG